MVKVVKGGPSRAAYQIKSGDLDIILRIMIGMGGSRLWSQAMADEDEALGSIECPGHIRFRVHRWK